MDGKSVNERMLLKAGTFCSQNISCTGCPIEAKFRNRAERYHLCNAAQEAVKRQVWELLGDTGEEYIWPK